MTRELVGRRHGLALGQQASRRVLGLLALGRGVVLLLKGADQFGDLRRLLDLPLDRLIGAIRGLAELLSGRSSPVEVVTEPSRASAAGG